MDNHSLKVNLLEKEIILQSKVLSYVYIYVLFIIFEAQFSNSGISINSEFSEAD